MKTSRFHRTRRGALPALLFALALATAACGAPAATTAPAEQAAPAAEQAAPAAAPAAIAMAEAPQNITPQQYQEEFAASSAPHQLIDVRTPEEFSSGHIAGAVNIPVQELEQRLVEVSKDQPVVLYCRSGNRSAQAATILNSAGYTGVYDLGGVQAWQQAGYELQ